MEKIKYDAYSDDGLVGFLEGPHTYTYIPDPSIQFKSGSGVSKKFEVEQDWDKIAKAYIKKHNLTDSIEEVRAMWAEKGRIASELGTMLHEYGEKCCWTKEIPKDCPDYITDDPRKAMVDDFVDYMRADGFEYEAVEKLVYNIDSNKNLCGLIDMELYKIDPSTGEKKFYIYDYKFVGKPLDKTGFYVKGKGVTKMKAPFHELPDTNFYHYSIQQAMYAFLDDKKIEKKVLVEFTPKGWAFKECWPIEFFINENGKLDVWVQPMPKKKRKYKFRKKK